MYILVWYSLGLARANVFCVCTSAIPLKSSCRDTARMCEAYLCTYICVVCARCSCVLCDGSCGGCCRKRLSAENSFTWVRFASVCVVFLLCYPTQRDLWTSCMRYILARVVCAMLAVWKTITTCQRDVCMHKVQRHTHRVSCTECEEASLKCMDEFWPFGIVYFTFLLTFSRKFITLQVHRFLLQDIVIQRQQHCMIHDMDAVRVHALRFE